MLKAISYWSFLPEAASADATGAASDSWSAEQAGTTFCPPAKAMRLARDHGYDALEMCVGLDGPLTPATSQQQCEQWRQEAAQVGIKLDSVASGMTWGCCPTHLDPAVRRQAIDNHAAALRQTAWLGAKTLLFVPGAVLIPWEPSYKPVRYDLALQWAEEAVRELGDLAAELQVELAVENVWNGLFYSPMELMAFIDRINNPSVGVYFDIGNHLNHQQWPPHWIELLAHRIQRIHVKDFKLSVGTLEGFCDLLDGDVPWLETMQALRKIGYDRTMTAEMMPPDETLLQRTSLALDKILNMK